MVSFLLLTSPLVHYTVMNLLIIYVFASHEDINKCID